MSKFLRVFLCVLAFFCCLNTKIYAQAPVADFSANTTTACAPALITFTDHSTGSPTAWEWNLGNSTIAINQNPSTSYTTPGTYTVSLKVTNSSGTNTKTLVNYITIVPAPIVGFTSTDTAISCAPKAVSFTNTSNPNSTGATTYLWDFGDGSFSSQVNPTHTYTVAGTYNVSLVVTNGAGCTNVFNRAQYVRVAPQPTAGFTAINNNSCTAPVTASFTNTSSGAVSYLWDFGDGGTSTAASPTHTYTTSGSFTVKLIATNSNGCRDTIIKPAFANVGTLAVGFTASTLSTCTNKAITFTNTTNPGAGNCRWDFGDGTFSTSINPTHSYQNIGNYTVKLVVNYNNCSDSTTKVISVTQGPNLQFSSTNNISCNLPQTVNFNNTSSNGASYTWFFGDGGTSTAISPSHTYTAAGQYTVTLIGASANGCTDTLIKNEFVKITPITGSIGSINNPELGCVPVAINPAANIASVEPIVSYSWNFGDGNVGSGISPTHTYTTAGTFVITLTVTTTGGCTYVTQYTVHTGTRITPSFTATPTSICLGQPVVFQNNTTGPARYYWLFGDGSSSADVNPTHFYGNFGSFRPLLISSYNGCIDSFRTPNVITVVPPLADFVPKITCGNRLQVSFIDHSIGAATYSWDFGDGSPVYTGSTPPTHTFPAFGSYNVSLTVTNGGACSHTRIIPLDLFNLSAIIEATNTTKCLGTPIVFNAISNINYTRYIWYYGDGTVDSSSSSVTHNYATAGNYIVSLVVRDAYNCRDSASVPVSIHGINPAFTASTVQACSPAAITFTDNSTHTSTIVMRNWNFGDGTVVTAPGTTITHTYTVPGTYTVKLNLADIAGCSAELIKPAYIVINRPTAAYTASSTNFCLGNQVSFTNTSTGVAPLSYAWSFGDGNTSTLQNPSHTYSATGIYNARLIVTDGTGCKDTLTRVISVSTVVARFNMSDSVGNCPPLNVSFTNASSGGSSYLWDFGNGSTSTSFSPSNVYSAPGVYTVRLVVSNATGCRDTLTRTVRVNSGATGSFTYSPTSGCYPLTVTFRSTTLNATAVTFDFNNGNTQTTSNGTATYTYTSPGIYVPVMVLSSGPGCNTSIVGADTIRINRVTTGFSATPNTLCLGGTVSFRDTSSVVGGVITTRSWDFGDGNTATGTTPAHIYTNPGTYNVRLIAGTASGCQDTTFRTVIVHPKTMTATQDKNICIGSSVALLASGATTYTWTPAATLSCSTCPSPIATPTTTTTYTVTGTNAFGCSSTATATVTVNPLPSTLNAGANQTICVGGSAVLNATGASSYTWAADPSLSCLNCASPTATPLVTTTYFVTGNSTAGCSAGASVTVVVNQRPNIATTNKAHCAGSADTLLATGGVSYVWTPATGLSNPNIANPIATPATTTTYTVTGTDANGCTNTATAVVTVNTLPTVNVTGNTNICIGGSASLVATGAASYSWSPAATLSCSNCANPIATPTANTTYTVVGTNAAGCTATATITVVVNPLPSTLSAGPAQSVCAGSTATLNATGANTYTWNASPTLSCTNCASPVATPTATTTYCVTGTSTAGCTSTACVTVTVLPLPVITSVNKAHCIGGADTLSAAGGVSYVWSPATGLSCTSCTNPIATPAATTTYTVTGTGANGCTNTATSTVTVNPLPVITVAGNRSVCQGLGTALTASGAATYVWSPATGISNPNIANPVIAPASTTTYTVTGTSATGCVGTTTVTVTVNPLPNVTAGPGQETCLGSPVNLSASGASTYIWTPATGLSCTNCQSPTANPTVTTTYVVTGTDGLGCRDTGLVSVTIKPLPVVDAGRDTTICNMASIQLQASGGTNYTWSPAATLSCGNCSNPVASPTGTTTYTVRALGANGCFNSDQVTVSLHTAPSINAGPDQTICSGSSAQLQASGGSTYTWSPVTTLSCVNCANPRATPPATMSYKVVGTDIYGCVDSDEVAITVIQRDPTQVGPGGEICEGESFKLSASGGNGYTWIPAATLSSRSAADPVARPRETTTYRVAIQQGRCFSDTLSVTVVVHPLPSINAGSDKNIIAGGSVPIQTTGNHIATYAWSPSDGLSCNNCAEPVAAPTKTTEYHVQVTSEFGCMAGDDVTVFVTCDEKQLWLPNTFTPNGDGQNDRFYPHGKGITSVSRFRIYNRWGEVIYDVANMPTDDPNYGWDGTYKNQQLKPDVFVYYITAKCSTGEPLEIKGDITLIR